MKGPRLQFRFERMGATAPDPLPRGEVWLDVGNRVAPRVLDHHSGQQGSISSTRLAFEHHEALVEALSAEGHEVTLVLHSAPDLDAIGAAWLVARRLELGHLPGPAPALEAIVRAIDDSDLGFAIADDVRRSWTVVMRLRLEGESEAGEDQNRVRHGFTALDTTLSQLRKGHDLEQAAVELTTPTVGELLSRAQQDYEADFARGQVFEANLPEVRRDSGAGVGGAAWRRTDGLHLNNPTSRLFKELARRDGLRSPAGLGFQLLVVSWSVDGRLEPPLWRHVVSTDPRSGLHLDGLGHRLELLEQDRENATRRPLLPGRERVGEGRGRLGSNVTSPWYDGRGHAYTIVDSPSVLIDGHPACASCLPPKDILDAIRGLARTVDET